MRRYTLPKLITLIINSFYSMLCRGVLQTPTQQTPAQQTLLQQTPIQLKTVKYRVIANFSPSLYLLTSII
ncbi:hypothetical protein HMPREF9073_01051 [Capnocytophaga sp. oral taxon 326 str. F0382]|nr:hypothetical protein HMPREF9073_01051 [Capnocytophaga sp. oral taxon 326 str. F0382]